MKYFSYRFLALGFALASATMGFAAESPDDLIEKGKVFDRKFQANDALMLYLSAEKVEPKNPDLLVRIARQYRYLMTDAADTQEKLRLGHIALDYSERAAACGPKVCDAQLAPAITPVVPSVPRRSAAITPPSADVAAPARIAARQPWASLIAPAAAAPSETPATSAVSGQV